LNAGAQRLENESETSSKQFGARGQPSAIENNPIARFQPSADDTGITSTRDVNVSQSLVGRSAKEDRCQSNAHRKRRSLDMSEGKSAKASGV